MRELAKFVIFALCELVGFVVYFTGFYGWVFDRAMDMDTVWVHMAAGGVLVVLGIVVYGRARR